MNQYLLSVHTCQDDAAGEPMTDEDMQRGYQQMMALETDMRSVGALLLSAKLHEPDTATVVRMANGAVLTTDGPFVESKEHLGGFYIINADDLDAALGWASRVTELIGKPIEVRPFAGLSQG
jgi:hypothetical protein